MTAYYVRLILDGVLAEVGLAIADDDVDLFWVLDQFTSPYLYEFSEALSGDAVMFPAAWMAGKHGTRSVRFIRPDSSVDMDVTGPYLSRTAHDQFRRPWRRFASADYHKPTKGWVVTTEDVNDARK